MCGIVGYIGNKEAYPILIGGLEKLEYRGYDLAGIALVNGILGLFKKKGKVADLEEQIFLENKVGNIGIGLTRWATHGEPSDLDAHPHQSMNGIFSLVHNGIIENYVQLKSDLQTYCFVFRSETDTEVLTNLMEYFYN